MGTPHNAAENGQIAKKVLMPGDPLRAKFIAETYLENPVCFNTVRNCLGYTGTYKGKEVSVMASGMGCSSIGIYSYELYSFYGVEEIIRVGSAGALQDDIKVMDVIIAMGACTDTSYANQYKLPGTFAPIADYGMVARAVEAAGKLNVPVKVGNVLSSEVFYNDDTEAASLWKKMGVLCTEMECAALFMNAARLGKKALGIMTISDHIFSGENISAEARQTSFKQMMEIALEV